MADSPLGPGWWQASDGRWYPPEQRPGPPTGSQSQQPVLNPSANAAPQVTYRHTSAGRATANTVGNILWLLLAGIWLAIGYVLAGIINAIFIITIPFALQAFKLASYALWPFGRVVIHRQDRDVALGCLGNAIWFVFGGVWLTLAHLLTGVLLCLTVIGLPFGIASFKMAGLALAPFGKMVVPRDRIPVGATVAFSPPE